MPRDPLGQHGPDDAEGVILLVVGLRKSEWTGPPEGLPPVRGVHFSSFEDLGAQRFHEVRPDIVLSPLMGETFDVSDLAQSLDEMGFEGKLRALCRALPDTGIVKDEIRKIAPSVDFDIMVSPTAD